MPIVAKYDRNEVRQAIEEATAKHPNARPIQEWGCDCGCENMIVLRRTDVGLALTSTAWPVGMPLTITVFQNEGEVERWLANMGNSPMMRTEAGRNRYERLSKWTWSVWYDN